jgi:hypothetical protein
VDHREVRRSVPAIVGDLEIEPRTTAARPLAGLANPTVVAFFEGRRLGSAGGREVAAIPTAGGAIPTAGRWEIAAITIPPGAREIAAVSLTRRWDVPAA